MSLENENLEPTGSFAESIRDLRGAVTYLSEQGTGSSMSTANWLAPARQRRRRHQRRVVLGWASAAVLCAATLPMLSHSPAPSARPAVETTATATAPQNSLLEQVDQDVSESVPSSLAPLQEMDNWNSSNTSDAASSDAISPETENTNADH